MAGVTRGSEASGWPQVGMTVTLEAGGSGQTALSAGNIKASTPASMSRGMRRGGSALGLIAIYNTYRTLNIIPRIGSFVKGFFAIF